jgi:hypothetical protein
MLPKLVQESLAGYAAIDESLRTWKYGAAEGRRWDRMVRL